MKNFRIKACIKFYNNFNILAHAACFVVAFAFSDGNCFFVVVEIVCSSVVVVGVSLADRSQKSWSI